MIAKATDFRAEVRRLLARQCDGIDAILQAQAELHRLRGEAHAAGVGVPMFSIEQRFLDDLERLRETFMVAVRRHL